MQLYVLDRNFTVLGIIDNYECLMWKRNYYKSGIFSMQIIPTFEQFELLKKGNILLKNDNTKEAMYIDHRELEENEEGVEILVVSGYSLTQWLDRRITLYKEVEEGNAETVIRNYVDRHCINPVETNRKIDNIIQGINNNLGDIINFSSHYKQLLDEIETISNSKAIFSAEFENISNQKYIDSDNNYRNMVLVAGAGEDAERKIISLGIENKGLDRYELFVDARDISDTKQQGENEVSIPIEEYNKLLEVRGNEKLYECTKVETFDCTLTNVNSLAYRVDFDLGDKVSIINKKWGLMLNERIISITETYDSEGLNIDIEIGNNLPTLIEKIKRKMR